jgi:predicted dehydrogenase
MTFEASAVRVAIIGTGWMAATHTEALRRLGMDVVGVAGRTYDRAKETAHKLGVSTAYASVDDLSRRRILVRGARDEPERRPRRAGVSCTARRPARHLREAVGHQRCRVKRAGGLGRRDRTGQRGVLQPAVRSAQQQRGRDGAQRRLGAPRNVTGGYHQDWLLLETDWNWRLVAERQGMLRAVADIGSHWLDLVRYVTGLRAVEILADLHTFVPERNHPLTAVGTFAREPVPADVERVREPMGATTRRAS